MASRRQQINQDAANPFGGGGRQDMSVQDADALLFGNMDPTVLIAALRLDGGTQPRASLDEDTLAEYTEAMQRGDRFPPVVVFFDGTDHWLADGFHRVRAAERAGLDKVRADIKQGTRRDAVLHSVGVNAQHGLRRSNADKRRAVETLLADPEWNGWSDNEIARRCKVSQPFVSKLRVSLTNNDYKLGENERRKAQRGDETYTIKTSKIAKAGKKRAARPAQSKRAESEPVGTFGNQEVNVSDRIMAALWTHGDLGPGQLRAVSGLGFDEFDLVMNDLVEDGWVERIQPPGQRVSYRARAENPNAVGNLDEDQSRGDDVPDSADVIAIRRRLVNLLMAAAECFNQLGDPDEAKATRDYAKSLKTEWRLEG